MSGHREHRPEWPSDMPPIRSRVLRAALYPCRRAGTQPSLRRRLFRSRLRFVSTHVLTYRLPQQGWRREPSPPIPTPRFTQGFTRHSASPLNTERPAEVTAPITPRARRCIELGADEAKRLKHDYVGTEHLLLGILREGEGVAAGVLESMGVSLAKVRNAVLFLVNSPRVPEEIHDAEREAVPQLSKDELKEWRESMRWVAAQIAKEQK